ncbi:glycosyltransferase [Microvirga guangxiensis]|uniref:glycosyltransferase n=1 Tax=Microvirga guangxiensis TaxID=549386 RepID=UPI00158732E1|nr:glycosyltransferase [Microvirga guangxiensis]
MAKTQIVYPLVEDRFRKINPEELNSFSAPSLKDIDLSQRFILSVTGIHRSKNVKTLLEAYMQSLSLIGREIPLVIVLPSEGARLEFIRQFGTPLNVIPIAAVSEEELAYLYNRADFVVQPSLYEGFGYPVAEALSCGAAVITTTSSSLPEIAGDAALLVDPINVEEMAQAIVTLATDRGLRAELKQRAITRARLFHDPTALGTATYEAYKRVARSECRASPDRRPIAAIWSSMPPLDCGVADYSRELVDALAATHDVDVYVDGKYRPDAFIPTCARYRHPRDFDLLPEPTMNIFQMGGRSYQQFMYEPIRRHRGTVVLHDLSMSLGFYFLAKGGDALNEFEDKVVLPEGEHAHKEYGRMLAQFRDPPRDVLDGFFDRHKLLRWLVESTDSLLVHTEPLRSQLKEEYPDANTRTIRMGATDMLPKVRHLPMQSWRQALGIKPNALCIGCFGIVDKWKRLDLVARAFEELCNQYPTSVLLIVGRAYDAEYRQKLEALTKESRFGERIALIDYASPNAFHALMALVDVVVNIRWPSRLGMSAILVRALAAGKPTIISDIPEWREIPEEVCPRVTPGETALKQLSALLIGFASDPATLKAHAMSARKWFLSNGTLDAMRADYLSEAPRKQ